MAHLGLIKIKFSLFVIIVLLVYCYYIISYYIVMDLLWSSCFLVTHTQSPYSYMKFQQEDKLWQGRRSGSKSGGAHLAPAGVG
jgi:hypothetical protein